MNIYERYGIKQEQLERVTEKMEMTLGLLDAIKKGDIDLNKLTVTTNGWEYKKD